MPGVVTDEGLIADLNLISAPARNLTFYLDRTATAPAPTDVFSGINQPTDANYLPVAAGTPTSTGGTGNEQYTYPPALFGPMAGGTGQTVNAWCLVLLDPITGTNKLLFRKLLATAWDTNPIGASLVINAEINVSTS